jgi:hypothetical protein
MIRMSRVAVSLSAVLALCDAAHAQDNSARHTPPAHIQWRITVISDSRPVDQFEGVTAVGQSKTLTHQRAVSHPVGCNGAQTPSISLSRTITVAPLGVDAKGEIGFAVSAEEMVEDQTPRTVRSDGCALPPSTRTLNAHHPELDVQSGGTVSWTLLKKDPSLIYQVEASVQPAAADD